MNRIGLALPGTPDYLRASAFVKCLYAARLNSQTAASPDVFAYFNHRGEMIGCIGLYHALMRPRLFFEFSDPPNAGERLMGESSFDRKALGEIGSRAVLLPKDADISSTEVSIALTAQIACAAYERGISHLGFVTNRMVRMITDALGFELMFLGNPDFSSMDQSFQENLKGFFGVKQLCMGFSINTLTQCREKLEVLVKEAEYA